MAECRRLSSLSGTLFFISLLIIFCHGWTQFSSELWAWYTHVRAQPFSGRGRAERKFTKYLGAWSCTSLSSFIPSSGCLKLHVSFFCYPPPYSQGTHALRLLTKNNIENNMGVLYLFEDRALREHQHLLELVLFCYFGIVLLWNQGRAW